MIDFEEMIENPTTNENKASEPMEIVSNTNTVKNKKRFDPFEDMIEPLEPNIDNLKRFSRMYTASSPVHIPNNKMEIVDRVINKINQLGFTFRSMGDNKDNLNSIITERASRKEYYLPWKKFNESVDAIRITPSEKAYRIGCWFDLAKRESINNFKGRNIPREDIVADYNSLSTPVKTFIARNVHLLLGDDVETASNFMIVYTECGAEKPKDIKWDKAGKTGAFIEMCDRLNIPVFNISKDDFENRLNEYLDTFK